MNGAAVALAEHNWTTTWTPTGREFVIILHKSIWFRDKRNLSNKIK